MLHLAEAVQQRVELSHAHAAAFGNALTPARVEDLRIAAFLRRHPANHSFHAAKFLFTFTHVRALHHLRAAGQHADQIFERAEFFHLAQLFQKIFERELALAHLFFHALRFIKVHGLGGLFYEADDVAHAEDALGHAFGMERLEVLQLFADTGEFDRLAGDRFQTQRRAAARVAVQLGEDRPGDVERLIEMRRDVDGFLAGGGVQHEQDFLRLDQVAQTDEFLHERFVDLHAAGGVEDERVAVVRAGEVKRFTSDFQYVRFAALDEDWNLQFLAERFELIHRGGPINIRRDQQRRASLFFQQPGKFAAGGGFAGAVQADHHQARGIAAQLQACILRTEQLDQFVVDEFDDLLAGLDALDDLLADRLLLDAINEIARHFEIHVGVQQRQADFTQRIGDVGVGNPAESAQIFENILELAAQRIEHGLKVGFKVQSSKFKVRRRSAQGALTLPQ